MWQNILQSQNIVQIGDYWGWGRQKWTPGPNAIGQAQFDRQTPLSPFSEARHSSRIIDQRYQWWGSLGGGIKFDAKERAQQKAVTGILIAKREQKIAGQREEGISPTIDKEQIHMKIIANGLHCHIQIKITYTLKLWTHCHLCKRGTLKAGVFIMLMGTREHAWAYEGRLLRSKAVRNWGQTESSGLSRASLCNWGGVSLHPKRKTWHCVKMDLTGSAMLPASARQKLGCGEHSSSLRTAL